MRRLAGVGLLLSLGGAATAQEAAAPRFEVVSVKPNTSGDTAGSLRPEANGVTGRNVTPMRLVRVAYQVADFQVVDAPGWFASERYDVAARAAEPVSMAQLAPMLKTLLADRFGLRMVQRQRETTVLEVQVDPGRAHRMTPSPRPCVLAAGSAAPVSRDAGTPACFSTSAGSMVARGVTAAMLAQELTRRLERFVIDRSGLTQTFDFDLQWAPDAGGVPAADAPASDLPPLVTAVREQLGLRLVSARASVDVYVVEAVSRPGPD